MVLFGCIATENGRLQPDAGSGVAGDMENTGSIGKSGVQGADAGSVDDVIFDRVKGRESIIVCVSKLSDFKVERLTEDTLVIKFANMFVPAELRTKLSDDSLRAIDYVLPLQKTIEGKDWAYFEISLKKMVPYSVNEDAGKIVIAFDASAIPESSPMMAQSKIHEPKAEPAGRQAKQEVSLNKDNDRKEKTEGESTATPDESKMLSDSEKSKMLSDSEKRFSYLTRKPLQEEKEEQAGTSKGYTGDKISFDFQDADIKDVLRLISEVSNFNIITSPGVKGKISVNMKEVPWDQALDTILEANGLGKKESGNIITVFTLSEMNKMDEDRKKADETRQKKEAAEGKLRQISIEAKIVEAVTSFSRNLGVQWGAGKAGSWNDRSYAILGGTNPSTAGLTQLPEPGIGLTGERLAVNFPFAVEAPSIGIAVGGARDILDAQLRALEDTGEGKIISSPKVTTLDGVEAMIEQGEEVPYKKLDESGNTTIEWKKAVLQLTVMPAITPDGEIALDIKALNDYADWTRSEKTMGEPPIIKNAVESKVVVKDGDTIVVGGIYKSVETKGTSGVPWLSRIPVLGWLFKTETKTREKREILIFITPKIAGETPEDRYARGEF